MSSTHIDELPESGPRIEETATLNETIANSQSNSSPNCQVSDLSPADENNSNNVANNGNLTCDRGNNSSSSVEVSSSPIKSENQSTGSGTAGPIRVPGTYPPEWLPDHETDSCMSCDSLFTLIKRRHHCRSCGKIFCSDCCRQRAKLLYLDNKEARVCSNCFWLIEYTLIHSERNTSRNSDIEQDIANPSSSSQTQANITSPNTSTLNSSIASTSNTDPKVHGVLKIVNQTRASANEHNTSSSSLSDQQSNKQVIFADGIRPGTDLSESFPYPIPSSSNTTLSPSSSSFSLLTRQNRAINSQGSSIASATAITATTSKKIDKSQEFSHKNITVCDDIGYLPPIVISKHSPIANCGESLPASSSSNSLTGLIVSQFKSSGKKSIQASMESRSCPLNGIVKFEDISALVGSNDVVTFLLLKDFYLKVKLTTKECCIDKELLNSTPPENSSELKQLENYAGELSSAPPKQSNNLPKYWCFTSEGLARYGQHEVVLIIDKEEGDSCVPRDVFKIYLTLHELALRRQSLENMGNLLFQDGLFGNKDTAGLLFVKPLEDHCFKNIVLPSKTFLVALVLQRWEVPWSKVFPMRLLLRLGHKFGVYPYPIISYRIREPVYYEVGHTIISILGDFRNFRYSMTHVDGLKVMLNKSTRKVLVQLNPSCFSQFNKVLDSSTNEHVLAWSSCPFNEANGHLVSVQNEDGQYETVEFYKKSSNKEISFDKLESGEVLGASFIIFSGALKVNQTGQSAKISIVEDGLLIQIQSCTMVALKNAINYMHNFDIDCENNQDPLNRVEIDWGDVILEDS